MKEKEKIVYGTPISPEKMPKPRKRLPEYDECLKAFLKSGQKYWKVNVDVLPSRNMKVVLSSLKWRIKHKKEYGTIRVIMSKNEIYLEKVKGE